MSSAEHTVLGHLGLRTDEYDAEIRRFIPAYDEMLATAVRWLDGHVPDGGLVLELGTGTGALAMAILDALPTVRLELIDIDPAMLELAAARVARHGRRATPRRASFADALPPCDAVVASLALHHVADLTEKRGLYRRVHDALRPGGMLLVADATVHEAGASRQRVFAEWSQWMQQHGISAAAAEAHFAQWASEDRYYPLATELESLAVAGFARPECFWKLGPISVYGAFRSDPEPRSGVGERSEPLGGNSRGAAEGHRSITLPEQGPTASDAPLAAIGVDGLRAVIADFYQRVFDDPMIGFMFAGKDQRRLIDKEVELAARLLGGDQPYTGRPLRAVHAPHKIFGGQFDRRLQILRDAMAAAAVDAEVQRVWIEHTLALRSQITADAGSDCGAGDATERTAAVDARASGTPPTAAPSGLLGLRRRERRY